MSIAARRIAFYILPLVFIALMLSGCVMNESPAQKLKKIEAKYLSKNQLAPENIGKLYEFKAELKNLKREAKGTNLENYIDARLLLLESKEHIINASTEMKRLRQLNIDCKSVDFEFIESETNKAIEKISTAERILSNYKEYAKLYNDTLALKNALELLLNNIQNTKELLCR